MGLRAVGRQPFRNTTASRIRFDTDTIIHGRSNSLLAAQVAFGGLNRNMPQQELNLL